MPTQNKKHSACNWHKDRGCQITRNHFSLSIRWVRPCRLL